MDFFIDMEVYFNMHRTEVFDGITRSHHTLRHLQYKYGTECVNNYATLYYENAPY